MQYRFLFLSFLATVVSMSNLLAQTMLQVAPQTTKAIAGISELNRSKYLNLSDEGTHFQQQVANKGGASYFLDSLGISFGRSLGLVYSEVKWHNSLPEDPNRKGFVNLAEMQTRLQTEPKAVDRLRLRYGDHKLDVVYHDRHNAFPTWMKPYTTDRSGEQWIPHNLTAATEISLGILEHKFNAFNRPAYFEPVNEPHWSFWGDQHFADWHVALQKAVNARGLSTQIGGPCSSVAYYYGKQYQSLQNFTQFIDQTDFQLDFYSFHVYDFLHWDAKANDYRGRISSGLPIAGVLDALAAYTHNQYGQSLKMVISEHGGYENDGSDGKSSAAALAQQYFPGQGFEWELEKRSIVNYNMVSSSIANTMVFMDNPHIIQKAVPFILLESAAWDPTYYASLMVPWDFEDKQVWAETKLVHFYQYFAGVKGRRVVMHGEDPDLQHTAFVDENHLHVLVNNLSDSVQQIALNNLYEGKIERIKLKRLYRQADFRPTFEVISLDQLSALSLKPREAIALEVIYQKAIEETSRINEVPYYAREVAVAFQGKETFQVELDRLDSIAYANLRIGLNRPKDSDHRISVRLNGTLLSLPTEDTAPRLVDEKQGYATCKLISVDPTLLKANNQVEVQFHDDLTGGVGSVVIRAGLRE